MPGPTNSSRSARRSARHSHWLSTGAVLVCAFAVALLLYAVLPGAGDGGLRAQGGAGVPPKATGTSDPSANGTPATSVSENDTRSVSTGFGAVTGSVTGVGSVSLDWDNYPTATSYQVRLRSGNRWRVLPWRGATVAFSGSSALITGLPDYGNYRFQARAASVFGNTRWSQTLVLNNIYSEVDTATPGATATPTATATAGPTTTATPTATVTADPTATATVTATSTSTPFNSPTPTATPTPVATSTATATSTPDPDDTATPTPSPTSTPVPGSLTDIDVTVNILGETVVDINSDPRFAAKETLYLDCVSRETGSRPASFQSTLRMYSGTDKIAIDTCDDETDMFDTYHTVAKEKLKNLMDTEPMSPGARAVLTTSQMVRSRYSTIFDSSTEEHFAENVGAPEVMKQFAAYRSDWLVNGNSSSTGSSENPSDCLDQAEATGTFGEASLAKKLGVLSCVALKSDYSFWLSHEDFNRIARDERGWVSGEPFDDCTFPAADINVAACRRHDIAFASLQTYVKSDDDTNDLDAAWNPRNKFLADYVFHQDIATHGCAIEFTPSWWILNEVAALATCASVQALTGDINVIDLNPVSHEDLLALIYHFAVSHFPNNKGWVITTAEVEHAIDPNNREFVDCMPPWPSGLTYSNEGWEVTADWNASDICIPGIILNQYKFGWAVVLADGSDEGDELDYEAFSSGYTRPASTTSATETFSGSSHISDRTLRGVALYDFKSVPSNVASNRWFDGNKYPIPQRFITVLDATALITSFTVVDDVTTLETGDTTTLSVQTYTWRTTGAFEYLWQVHDGTSWENFTDGVSVSGTEAEITSENAGVRSYRVIATHRPLSSDADRRVVSVASDEIHIIYTDPTSTGEILSVSHSAIGVGEFTKVRAEFSVPVASGASFDTSGHVHVNQSCSGRSDIQTRATNDGTLRETFYGCSGGEARIDLIEVPNGEVLDTVNVIVNTSTPTPTPVPPTSTPEPTGSVWTEDDDDRGYVEVGDRVLFEGRYDVNGGWGYLDPSYHFNENSNCQDDADFPARPRWAGTIRKYYYACAAGNGRITLHDSVHDEEIARVTVRVKRPPTATATPRPPTATPRPPTATPRPATGSLDPKKDSVEIREKFVVHGIWNVPNGRYSLSITNHFHTSATCAIPRGSEDQSIDIDPQALGEFWKTFYGCRAGTGTITLKAMPGEITLHSVTVEVTLPDVPRPTGVDYTPGENWLLFDWDPPSGGWDTFETKLDSGSWEETTNTYKRYNFLISGASYVFRVRTKASDGRTSNTVVIYAQTICSDCNLSESYEMALESFGDGAHLVGDDIAAGVYRMGDGTQECIWGRVNDSETVYEQIIEEGGLNADRTVHIRETDHGFFTFGCGTWTKQ